MGVQYQHKRNYRSAQRKLEFFFQDFNLIAHIYDLHRTTCIHKHIKVCNWTPYWSCLSDSNSPSFVKKPFTVKYFIFHIISVQWLTRWCEATVLQAVRHVALNTILHFKHFIILQRGIETLTLKKERKKNICD